MAKAAITHAPAAAVKPRRIVRMSRLADYGYDFSVKTCYLWCAQADDPMPHLDLGTAGKRTQYYVDLDELDAWLERRAKRGRAQAAATPPPVTPTERQRRRSRREECEAIGVEEHHAFA